MLTEAELINLVNEGRICPYCGADTIYVDSTAVYTKSYGMIYLCQPCDAYVGVHKGTANAKGRLADADLRYWKKQAHFYFDPIWQSELNKGEAKHIVRNRTYDWLRQQLGISRELTHIGFFDIDLCERTVEICKGIEIPGDQMPRNEKDSLVFPMVKYIEFGAIKDDRKLNLSDCLPKFQNKFGNNFVYDAKKFCYTLQVQTENNVDIFDYYPKANKVLFRKQNRWIQPGLKWLVSNFLDS